ncbi:unnamed protein product, partial [marine sediment metagenome]
SPIFISLISNPNIRGRPNPSSGLSILDKTIPLLLIG